MVHLRCTRADLHHPRPGARPAQKACHTYEPPPRDKGPPGHLYWTALSMPQGRPTFRTLVSLSNEGKALKGAWRTSYLRVRTNLPNRRISASQDLLSTPQKMRVIVLAAQWPTYLEQALSTRKLNHYIFLTCKTRALIWFLRSDFCINQFYEMWGKNSKKKQQQFGIPRKQDMMHCEITYESGCAGAHMKTYGEWFAWNCGIWLCEFCILSVSQTSLSFAAEIVDHR